MNPHLQEDRLRIQGIVLAAGRGSRFGADKLLVPLADGRAMVLHSAERLRAVLPNTLIVVRPGAGALLDLLVQNRLPHVVAANAELGMGHSVAAAVAATPQAQAWLIALADMPYVQPHTLARLIAALEGGAQLVAPRFHGRRGNPVGFGAPFRDALLELRGDAGARFIVQQHAAQMQWIEVDDPGVVHDIDTPADLAAQEGRRPPPQGEARQ